VTEEFRQQNLAHIPYDYLPHLLKRNDKLEPDVSRAIQIFQKKNTIMIYKRTALQFPMDKISITLIEFENHLARNQLFLLGRMSFSYMADGKGLLHGYL